MYSEPEVKLLKHFIPDFEELKRMCNHSTFYKFATQEAFLYPEKFEEKYINALKSVLIMMDQGPVRMSERFDNAITYYIGE
jgi:hypothetical protein